VALVQEPAAPEPGSRVIADWEQRRPEPKQRAVAPTRRVRHPIDRDRWLAGVGLAAIVILAGVSLGSRYLFDATRLEPRASDSPAAGGAPPESAAVRSARPASGAGVASAPTEAAPAAPPPVVVATPPSDTWSIQVASFRTTDRANRLADQLRGETGERVTVSSVNGESGIWYRVLVGEYATREEVATRMEELRTQYDFGFLRRVRVRSGEVAR
jgi:cell division septation protein DedD